MKINENRKKIIIAISIVIISLLIMFLTYYSNQTETVSAETEIELKTEEKETIEEKIKVEIKGAVNNPGVYEIELNSRVIDVINAAGGLLENADTSLINMSKKLTDEMVIIIYTKEEIENYNNSKIKTEYVYIEVNNCPDKVNDACIKEYQEETEETEETTKNNLININTATIQELTTLSGIGESKAKAIIEYREKNGKFKEINDLTNVSGIGESLIEKIKDNITV